MSQQNEGTRDLMRDALESAVANCATAGKSFGYTLPSDLKAREAYLKAYGIGWRQFRGGHDDL